MPARLPLALLLCLAPATLPACQTAPNPSGAGPAAQGAVPTQPQAPTEPLHTSDPGSRSLPLGAPVGALPAETWPLGNPAPKPAVAAPAPGASLPLPPPVWDR